MFSIFEEPGVYTHEIDPQDQDLGISVGPMPRHPGAKAAGHPHVHGMVATVAGFMIALATPIVDVVTPFGVGRDATMSAAHRQSGEQAALDRLKVGRDEADVTALPDQGALDYVEATDEEFTDFIARSSAFAFLDDDEPYSLD